MNKKAAVITSFSWIFMVIIGSFFILFAYNVISTYQENEEYKQQLEFKSTMQSIFKKVGYGKGSETTSLEKINYVFEDSRVELLCNDGFPILSVNGDLDGGNDYLKNYPFFMTVIEQDRVDEVYIAVEELDLPFYITPLMALVSQRNLYVFDDEIWDSTFKDKFSRTSAFKELNTKVVDLNDPNPDILKDFFLEIETLELSSITFVSSDTSYREIQLPSSMSQTQRINLAITQEDKRHTYSGNSYDYTSGQILYKTTSYWNSDLSLKYTFNYTDYKNSMTLPTFALFSTPESFSCGMETIDKLLSSTSSYYLQKNTLMIDEITNEFSSGKYCSENPNKNDILLAYTSLRLALNNLYQKQDRFKNIDELNSLLDELWISKERLEINNCIDIY